MFALMLKFYSIFYWLIFEPHRTFPQIAVLRCYLCAEKCAVEVLDAAKPQTFLRCSRGQTKYKDLLFWRSHSFDILLIYMCSRLHLCCASSTQVKFKEKNILCFKKILVFQ